MEIKSNKNAFSLIELSVVVVITGILVAGIMSGNIMIAKSKLTSAQALTKSSAINSIPDLALWLEPTLSESITGAASGNNLSNNDAVLNWNDISGNKLSVTQAAGANQPTYVTAGINNLPSIEFDGVNSILSTTAVPIAKGAAQYTIIAVWRPLVISSGILIEQKPAGLVNNSNAAIWLDSANFRFSSYFNDTTTLGTMLIDNNYIGIMVINNSDASNVSGYLNANTKTQLATSDPSALNLGVDFLSLGGRVITAGSFSNLVNVLMSEVIIFNRNLKPSEVNLVNNYLSKKYNISIS